MDFNDYQEATKKTAIWPDTAPDLIFPVLGLAGETGEVVEKIKKIFRDDNGVVSDEKREEIKKELGDVLWYLAQIAITLDIKLSDIAESNIEKTHSRYERGVSHGSGDNR